MRRLNPPYSPLMRSKCKNVRRVMECDIDSGLMVQTAQVKKCKTCKQELPGDTRFFKRSYPNFYLRPDCRKCEYQWEKL